MPWLSAQFKMKRLIFTPVIFSILSSYAQAQPNLPSDEQIKKIMDAQKTIANKTLRDVSNAPPQSLIPNNLPSSAATNQSQKAIVHTDLSKVVQRHTGKNVSDEPQSVLLVFVSFSMPEQDLIKLAQQASQTGAVLVLRGFATDARGLSLGAKATQERIASLLSNTPSAQDAGWIIEPTLFEQINIQRVPAVFVGQMASSECNQQSSQCQKQSYGSVVYGESVPSALSRIALRASRQDIKNNAKNIIK